MIQVKFLYNVPLQCKVHCNVYTFKVHINELQCFAILKIIKIKKLVVLYDKYLLTDC